VNYFQRVLPAVFWSQAAYGWYNLVPKYNFIYLCIYGLQNKALVIVHYTLTVHFLQKEWMRKKGAKLLLGNAIKIQAIILKGVNIVLMLSCSELPL